MEQYKKKENKKLYVALMAVLFALAAVVGVTTAVSDIGKKNALEVSENAQQKLELEVIAPSSDELPSDDESAFDLDDDPYDFDEVFAPESDTEAQTDTADASVETEQVTEDDKKSSVSADGDLPVFESPCDGAVVKPFSDVTPVFSLTMNDYRIHTGVDISAQEGSAVHAPAEGMIGAIWDDPMMGKCMTLVHSGGAVSTFKGLYETIPEGISEGCFVETGDIIAAVGDSALCEVAEDPHVHYELTVNGERVDPTVYVNFNEIMSYEG